MLEDPGLYDQSEQDKSSRGYATKVFFIEFAKIALLTIITIGMVRYFLFKPFYVKGASMEPNYYEKQYLIIDEITYRFSEPKRGEVIVFRRENDKREFFLKRIIGLPGEKIKVQSGKVVVYNSENENGVVVAEEDYLEDAVYTTGELTVTLNEDEYFVLGDNRNVSLDSRKMGAVMRDDIIGRAWLRGWPIEEFGLMDQPEYNL